MTDRYDEEAREWTRAQDDISFARETNNRIPLVDRLSALLRRVAAEAERRGYEHGQRDMRERNAGNAAQNARVIATAPIFALPTEDDSGGERALAHEPIPVGVHIGSKGCGDRYMSPREVGIGVRGVGCNCPPDRCWVDYARAEHKAGRAALDSRDWLASLAAKEVEGG